MVGQTIIKRGMIDVKEPSTATFGRGFRFKPWKTVQVHLVEIENSVYELQVYKEEELHRVYTIDNLNDVTMCGSKTHAHAFELISGGKSIVILSGQTELESRDWIWTFRNIFMPHAQVETELQGHPVSLGCTSFAGGIEHWFAAVGCLAVGCRRTKHKLLMEATEGYSVMLLPGRDTDRLNLSSGIYDMTVSMVAIRLNFRSACSNGDSRSTPVELFNKKDSMQSLSVALTTVAKFQLDQQGERTALVMETNPDSESGKGTFVLEQVNDDSLSPTMDTVLEAIKSVIFRATTNLHDCIAGTHWRLV